MEKEKKTTVGTFTQDPTKSIVKVQITRRIPDGVYIFTETVILGHTFILVSINSKYIVYTYGRYNDNYFDGVLLKHTQNDAINYLMKELYRFNAKSYRICDIEEERVIQEFDLLWYSSDKIPQEGKEKNLSRDGRIISQYKLLSSNCTTIVCNILKKSGTKIFDFSQIENFCIGLELNYSINPSEDLFRCSWSRNYNEVYFIDPEKIEEYLELLISNKNELVKEYTKTIRCCIPNTEGYKYSPPKELYRTIKGASQ
ncbi:hypothetical protein ACLSY8_04420 [Avibacterium avium]|uniref:hypothetical protein n=1 Tax=Avibacterium avium TaxID=751 RepID=UPI003BF7F8C5